AGSERHLHEPLVTEAAKDLQILMEGRAVCRRGDEAAEIDGRRLAFAVELGQRHVGRGNAEEALAAGCTAGGELHENSIAAAVLEPREADAPRGATRARRAVGRLVPGNTGDGARVQVRVTGTGH